MPKRRRGRPHKGGWLVKMRRERVLALVLLFTLLGVGGVWGASASEDPLGPEVRRLAREVPPESGTASGLVWQRWAEYELRADGALARRSRWIVELAAGTSEAWRLWEIPVPVGGSAELLACGLYDARTGRFLAPLSAESGDVGGLVALRMRVPRHENAVVALEYLQIFPRRMNVDDVVWLGMDLPQWEQVITVRTPKGSPLFWKGVDAPEPEISDEGPQDTYVWRMVNRPAWSGLGLLAQGRPVLTFSLRKGAYEALNPLEYLGSSLGLPEPGGAFARALRSGNRTAAGEKLLALMNVPSTLLEGAPWDAVRAPDAIPSEGPWTSWERVLLLHRWLPRAGWHTTLWWLPVLDLGDDAPATSRTWLRPVLEVKAPGGGAFFWDVGQNVARGEMPSTLWGATLFRREGARAERRETGGGALDAHRFSVEWTLSLDQEGVARGSLDVTLRGGWVGLFAPQGVPDAAAVLERLQWPVALRPALGKAERSTYDYGYRFSFPVTVPLGIPGSGRVLVRFPGVDIPWTADLRNAPTPVILRFPFVLEQRFSLALPPGYHALDLPKGGERGKRVVLKETVRYREKYHEVVGESRILVKGVRLGEADASELESALATLARWSEHRIPLLQK